MRRSAQTLALVAITGGALTFPPSLTRAFTMTFDAMGNCNPAAGTCSSTSNGTPAEESIVVGSSIALRTEKATGPFQWGAPPHGVNVRDGTLPVAVPLPATLPLFITGMSFLGLVGLLGWRERRKHGRRKGSRIKFGFIFALLALGVAANVAWIVALLAVVFRG